MNKIRINRLLLAGLVTLIVFVAVEIFVEGVIGRLVIGNRLEVWYQRTIINDWSVANHAVNVARALFNCMLFMWVYASLRPMFGVGYKTALITSGLILVIFLSVIVNEINLGLYPAWIGLVEWSYELIELPVALMAGSHIYEGMAETVLA